MRRPAVNTAGARSQSHPAVHRPGLSAWGWGGRIQKRTCPGHGQQPGNGAVVASPVPATAASLPDAMLGTRYSMPMLAVSGGTPPYTWSLSDRWLPPGLSLSPAGVISGSGAGRHVRLHRAGRRLRRGYRYRQPVDHRWRVRDQGHRYPQSAADHWGGGHLPGPGDHLRPPDDNGRGGGVHPGLHTGRPAIGRPPSQSGGVRLDCQWAGVGDRRGWAGAARWGQRHAVPRRHRYWRGQPHRQRRRRDAGRGDH